MSEILKSSEDLLIPMAREVIEHARSGTMKQAPEVMKLPAAHYTDSVRFDEYRLYWAPRVKLPVPTILKRYPLQGCL